MAQSFCLGRGGVQNLCQSYEQGTMVKYSSSDFGMLWGSMLAFGMVPCRPFEDLHGSLKIVDLEHPSSHVSKLLGKYSNVKSLPCLWGKSYHVLPRLVAEDGPYFLGKEISMVDIALFPFWQRFLWVGHHYRGLSHLEKFVAIGNDPINSKQDHTISSKHGS